MAHLNMVGLAVFFWICEKTAAIQFNNIDYCKQNCRHSLHVACPQPCFTEDCRFMLSTYNFRKTILNFHNILRDEVASGKFGNLVSASNMMALSYDMELEFLAYCAAAKNQHTLNMCARTKKGERVGQIQIMTRVNTVVKKELLKAMNLIKMQNVSLTPDIVMTFRPQVGNEEYDNLTQMINADTRRIGCTRCRLTRGRTYITCYYCPAGNIVGLPVYHPGEPATECPRGDEPNMYYQNLCGSQLMPTEGFYVAVENAVKTTSLRCLVSFCLIVTTMCWTRHM